MKVAFIGLGNMGFPMAGRLAAGGHQVGVCNRTAAKAEAWTAQHKGEAAATPAQAAEGAEIVFTCVGNDDELRGVVYGDDGALAGMAGGSILVDHTTASAGEEGRARRTSGGARFTVVQSRPRGTVAPNRVSKRVGRGGRRNLVGGTWVRAIRGGVCGKRRRVEPAFRIDQ